MLILLLVLPKYKLEATTGRKYSLRNTLTIDTQAKALFAFMFLRSVNEHIGNTDWAACIDRNATDLLIFAFERRARLPIAEFKTEPSSARRTKGDKHVPEGKRPCCVQCHRAMHSHGWYKGTIRRWFCTPCKVEVLASTPPKKAKPEDHGEALTAFVRERVTRMNGHDPQLRDDLVQELVTDVLAGKLKRKDVEKRETIRRDTHSQERLRQNRHRDVSIDQPRNGDEDGLKLKDVLEG
jgi:hypothetical protein